ncbi:MAG: pentapeptide repeat-containing protein [Rhodoplanes sp.]|uniref:hypothetical protein n=1 Tax=Rhodoplanes sp. TaxID=1968906 RepID=UPI0017C9ADFB|nr:hypothetical protein [Rhodoplanes sp.]NVO12668.1 pentapeptide repeat-containing protein [Rhodoplanes sp.]
MHSQGFGSAGRLRVGPIAATLIVIAAITAMTIAAGPGRAQDAVPPGAVKPDLGMVAACLAAGNEVVMAPSPACVPRQAGSGIAERAGMPLGERDWSKACNNGADPRKLPRDTVKRLARQADIAPTGIRIIGALFCDGLDLAGVDLPYSLVLDRSVFDGVVDARNLRVKGDLSLEYAVLFETLRLNRARIEGSVYFGGSFMRKLRVYDTQVSGSWQHKAAVVFLDAHLIRITVSGDLDMTRSAFSRLWLQSSQIGGTLGLDETEARCAYHINASTIGYLTADQAGFGKVVTIGAGAAAIRYPWWRHAVAGRPATYTQTLFRSAAISAVADAERRRITRPELPPEADGLLRGCREETETLPDGSERTVGIEGVTGSRYLEFYLFDTTVHAAFCLTAFNWARPYDGEIPDAHHPVTILALNGTRVDGNLIVDLWGDRASPIADLRAGHRDFQRVSELHKLEAIGLSAGAAIYNFADHQKPYITYLDGLKFGRVHKATPACGVDYGTKLASQVELPAVDEVLLWLGKNKAPSSQPFLTFVDAFEKAGADPNELRIQRKNLDLCAHTARWLPFVAAFCPAGTQATAASGPDPGGSGRTVRSSLGAMVAAVSDLIGSAFAVMLWALADHGLRPGKVVWWVAGVLAIFWLVLRFGLRVVAFQPAGSEASAHLKLWPVGPLFLFDRLIPLYKICNEHYAITHYYRLAAAEPTETPSIVTTNAVAPATLAATAPAAAAPDDPPQQATLRGRKILVRAVDEDTQARVDKLLVVLRVIGVVLTIFLLAALNALTR